MIATQTLTLIQDDIKNGILSLPQIAQAHGVTEDDVDLIFSEMMDREMEALEYEHHMAQDFESV